MSNTPIEFVPWEEFIELVEMCRHEARISGDKSVDLGSFPEALLLRQGDGTSVIVKPFN